MSRPHNEVRKLTLYSRQRNFTDVSTSPEMQANKRRQLYLLPDVRDRCEDAWVALLGIMSKAVLTGRASI